MIRKLYRNFIIHLQVRKENRIYRDKYKDMINYVDLNRIKKRKGFYEITGCKI